MHASFCADSLPLSLSLFVAVGVRRFANIEHRHGAWSEKRVVDTTARRSNIAPSKPQPTGD